MEFFKSDLDALELSVWCDGDKTLKILFRKTPPSIWELADRRAKAATSNTCVLFVVFDESQISFLAGERSKIAVIGLTRFTATDKDRAEEEIRSDGSILDIGRSLFGLESVALEASHQLQEFHADLARIKALEPEAISRKNESYRMYVTSCQAGNPAGNNRRAGMGTGFPTPEPCDNDISEQ